MIKESLKKILTSIPLVILIALLACGIGRSGIDLPQGDWMEHGFSVEKRDSLHLFFQDAIENGDIAGGALLLIHQNEVIFKEAFGYADLETSRPFTTENPCFIASVTKSVTSTVIIMLDEQGIFSLDDPVEKWIASFKRITIRDDDSPTTPPKIWECLSHRSGLPGNADLDPRFREFQGSLSEAVDEFAEDGLMAEPGTRWAYGRAGFMTAARAAEVATDKHFEILMQELVLDPLGMTSTTFHPSKEVIQELPRGYYRANDELVPRQRRFTESYLGDLINPGGGLFSTLDDMGRFLLFHLNQGVVNGKQLVSMEALTQMYQIPDELPEHAYGLGMNVDKYGNRVWHLGGSGTMIWIDFERDIAGVLFSQTVWRGNNKFQRNFNDLIRGLFNE